MKRVTARLASALGLAALMALPTASATAAAPAREPQQQSPHGREAPAPRAAEPVRLGQMQSQEEVTVRWWLVPVYAIDPAGAPVLNLSPADLEVRIKGLKVDSFSLIKKQFAAPAARRTPPSVSALQAPVQKKLVFLVFDAAFSPYNLLARAKSLADTVIAQSDSSAQYILLSIEPFDGLKYILGPTADLRQISKSMRKFVSGKAVDHMRDTGGMEGSDSGDSFPQAGGGQPGDAAGGGLGNPAGAHGRPLAGDSALRSRERTEWRDKKRVASSYTSALLTLDLVLGNFSDFSKVVYLYSCGIPQDALLDKSETAPRDQGAGTAPASLDSIALDSLKMVGSQFNKSGALLFLVNPAGTRLGETDKDSGEPSLRILASESGGRYFEGADKDIARQVNSMESGYYEVSFPDKPEYEGRELSFEIRSSRPDVQIFTVREVGREKTFADMTELEREVTVLYILDENPLVKGSLKVSSVAGEEGQELFCQIMLPKETARGEWEVFKIARQLETNALVVETETVNPVVPSVQVRMKWHGGNWRHDIVLAKPKTDTILIWK